MSTNQEDYVDVDEWHWPTMKELETIRREEGILSREMSKLSGYDSDKSYSTAVQRNSMSVKRLRELVDNLNAMNIVDWYLPTVDDIIAAMRERGIAQQNFSASIGYSEAGIGSAQRWGEMGFKRYYYAVQGIRFYDEHGYIPIPSDLEPPV